MSKTVQKERYTAIISYDEEESCFISKCEELHAFSQADTYPEILSNMADAISLTLETLGKSTEFDLLVLRK